MEKIKFLPIQGSSLQGVPLEFGVSLSKSQKKELLNSPMVTITKREDVLGIPVIVGNESPPPVTKAYTYLYYILPNDIANGYYASLLEEGRSFVPIKMNSEWEEYYLSKWGKKEWHAWITAKYWMNYWLITVEYDEVIAFPASKFVLIEGYTKYDMYYEGKVVD